MDNDIPQIDIDELAARIPTGIVLVDVREPDEFSAAHVPGALMLPLSQWPDVASKIPSEGLVYLICAKGGRSQKAAEYLAGQGRQVVNVAGGTLGWIDAGHPVETIG